MRTAPLNSCIAVFSSLALAGIAAAGCSSTSSPSAGGSAPVGTTASPSPTGAAAKLLAPKDLPNGWSADAAPAEPPTGDNACPLLNASLWNTLPAQGEADLSQSLAGPYLVEQIGIGTAAQANAAWKAMTTGVSHCSTYTHTGSSGSSTFKIASTEMPSYGDGSYAFTMDLTITGGVNATGDVVAARTGNSIIVLYIIGISGVDKSLVEGIVSKAVTKARS